MIMFVERRWGGYAVSDYNFHTSKEREYFINECGKCYSVSKKTGKVRSIKHYINTNGYPAVYITGKNHYIHRLIAEGYINNPNNLPVINHINGDKKDYNLNNLTWVTQRDNVIHAWQTGINKSTDKHKESMRKTGKERRKITMNEARELKKLYIEKGFNQKELCKIYSLSQSTISKIVNDKRYI